MRPICVDLFCGLGGWTDGFLAEGYECIGFDIEAHNYGSGGYPGQLVLQDALTIHGSQFRDAACIVASPPCQRYSYMAMPWKRAKALIVWHRESPERIKALNALFDACFRIQYEACEASGRHIPMVVENVKGAQPWVGRAKWHYGSYYLWGDVPALMPITLRSRKSQHTPLCETPAGTGSTSWFFGNSKHENRYYGTGVKAGDRNVDGKWTHSFADSLATKNKGGSCFAQAHNTESGHGQNPDGRKLPSGHDTFAKNGRPCNKLTDPRYGSDGSKFGGCWWHDATNNLIRKASSKSIARKAASAQIAKIPFPLAQHIARCFKPCVETRPHV